MVKGTPYIQPAQKDSWETPKDLFDALWEEADGFDCDPCCTPEQYTAQRIIAAGGQICIPTTPDFVTRRSHGLTPSNTKVDGLAQPWRGKVFMNPPYGLALRKWVPRAVEMVETGTAESVWALLPSKTDTQWWQKYVLRRCAWYPRMEPGDMQCDEVRFLKGRLTFGGAPDPAGFASVIVVWR